MSTIDFYRVTTATIFETMRPAVLNKANVHIDDALWLHRQPRALVRNALQSFRGLMIQHRVNAYYFSHPYAMTATPNQA